MARPREFDENAVLDAAINCFWSRGYEATSVRDLTESMGINGASLYNAFGDKRALYRRALDHYLSTTFGERVARLESTLLPRQAIEAFFTEIVERSLGDPQCKGCMMVNSALEVAPHDPEFREVAHDFLARAEGFFLRCVSAGQANGSIARAHSAEDLARLLLGVLLGIRVLARARPDRAAFDSMLRPLRTLIDAPMIHTPEKPA